MSSRISVAPASSAGAAIWRQTSHRFLATTKPKCSVALRASVAIQASLETVSLQCGATTVRIPVPAAEVTTLAATVNDLLKTFAEKQKGGAPRRYDAVECKITGERGRKELCPLFVLGTCCSHHRLPPF